MIILIPAYKPDQSLVRFVRALREQDPDTEILIIDDGSGSTYAPIFTELRIDGVTVQAHPVNKGKGAALRTGIDWVKANRPDEVIVTADADGQHLPRDIFRVGVPPKPQRWQARGASSSACVPSPTQTPAKKAPRCRYAPRLATAQP